jgi:hypothetical protein
MKNAKDGHVVRQPLNQLARSYQPFFIFHNLFSIREKDPGLPPTELT